MKLAELKSLYEKELKGVYTDAEIDLIFYWISEKITGKPRSILKLALEEEWHEFEDKKNLFIFHLLDLKRGKPIQYVLGETEFFGLRFFVNPGVLIPRPETEELVEWILNEQPAPTDRIVDLGTGSGCIAVSLKNKLPQNEIWALDVSEKALETARINAAYHSCEINFLNDDFLKMDFDRLPKFDIIVSNPPYIAISEKQQLDPVVVNNEPATALFVDDTDPLIFYRKIVDFGLKNLNPGGRIYVEINQNLAEETFAIFNEAFDETELKKDISGNFRMIRAKKLH